MAQAFGATSTTDEVLRGQDLRGKRILITGVSAGLGVETARALVAHGAEVIGAVRDVAKGKRATSAVGPLQLIELDLGSLASVRACADALVKEGKPLDVVIANAGVMAAPFGHTADGFETQFGTNHLGHFVLINRIASLLHSGGRIINLSSSGHRYANVELEDPNFERGDYDPWVAYGRSKTANILFAVELDRRHRERGVRAAALHPGGIQTELARHLEPSAIEGQIEAINAALVAEGMPKFSWKTVPQGAATSVWAATVADPNEIGGRYCENCHVTTNITDGMISAISEGVRPYALDPKNAAALWAKSEQLVGERF